MFETPFTIVGTIVTIPTKIRFGEQELNKFRVASNSRRRNANGDWEPGNSLYVTVNCWGNLAIGTSTLARGDGVVVVGHLYTSEYEDKEGQRRSSVEVRATAVGPDLSRCTAKIAPFPKLTDAPAAEPELGRAADDVATDAETGVDGEALPLTV